MADVVVHVVRNRPAGAPPDTRRMKGGDKAELETSRPDGIVVVLAVEAVGVQPERRVGRAGKFPLDRADGSLYMAGHHDRLERELARHEVHLGDGFFRRVGRDHGDWGHSIRIVPKQIRIHLVERPTRRAPDLLVVELNRGQSEPRIHHGKARTDFVHSLVEELWQHGGCQVEGIAGRYIPEGGPDGSPIASLFGGLSVPMRTEIGAIPFCLKALTSLRSGFGDEIVEEGRKELHEMSIRIDDRVVEAALG